VSIVIGGTVTDKGIAFWSEKNSVYAYLDKDNNIKIKTTNIFKKEHKILKVLDKIPFIRGIKVLMEVIIQHWKIFLILPIFFYINDILGLKDIPINSLNYYLLEFGIFFIVLLFIRFSSISKFHGAEHKIYNTYLKNLPLTIDNIKKESTISINCGANIIIYMIILDVIFNYFGLGIWRILLNFTISYELFRLYNYKILFIFRYISGLIQKYFTTSQPTEKEIKIGIIAIEKLLKLEENQQVVF